MPIRFAVTVLLGTALTTAYAQDTPPKQVVDLAGVYRGTWNMYGIDEKGTPVKRMAGPMW